MNLEKEDGMPLGVRLRPVRGLGGYQTQASDEYNERGHRRRLCKAFLPGFSAARVVS